MITGILACKLPQRGFSLMTPKQLLASKTQEQSIAPRRLALA